MPLNFNTPTPIEQYTFRDINFLLKRDDLISRDFSGNKARKIDYYRENLPYNIDTIVSYGSIQSNAMYSLAKFCQLQGLHFRYHANHIPSYLKYEPQGNFKYALNLGMELVEGYSTLEVSENELLISEGVATKEAYFGIKKLAIELIKELDKSEYQIFLPSGTGTTALFLSKALQELGNESFTVYTTACVGGSAYLTEQFQKLEGDDSLYPIILETKKKYHYGKLYREFYQIWLELQNEIGVEFELLYDPKAWITIFEHRHIFNKLLYIHQGGALGNVSMLPRYLRVIRKYGDKV